MGTAPAARILVVDDEEAILETMAFTFEGEYEVLTARDARTGLALLERTGSIAAVITDQRMPEMTGVQFLAQVWERWPSTTRIILTGFADLDAIVQAINEGHVYAYVAKPWEPEELKQVVRQAVAHHRLVLENQELLANLRRANLFLEAAMDEVPMGALAVDAGGVVRAANRAAREFMGLEKDPRGRTLDEILSDAPLAKVRTVAQTLAEEGSERRFEELELAAGGCPLRLRVGVRHLTDAAGQALGRVILLREISHEPLVRRLDEVIQAVVGPGEELRPRLERAVEELHGLALEVRGRPIRSSGMDEVGERISRTQTAIENWLSVDDALAQDDYPDARVLVDRMRLAMARWPVPEQVPEPVRELGRRVERYYESGDNPGERIL
jgi:PAS domain S-box-containing protein